MTSEGQWVNSLVPRLNKELRQLARDGARLEIVSGRRLPYVHEVVAYSADGEAETHSMGYQTDLLICDVGPDARWTPRVIIECKLGDVTTHDALTYSAKAATHKQVHPYLRYGFIIGGFGKALPTRLLRHGAYFDFMMVWRTRKGTPTEWKTLLGVLQEEVRASRRLERILTDRRHAKKQFSLFHRRLRLKGSGE